jgi:amino acid transporter/phospholipid N-methyltransferase
MAELEPKAGYGLVIALSITAMIGTGMFYGPAIAASYAGNASLIAWAILAIVGLYVGFCFAELSSMFPGVGGVYAFAKKAYGRFISFIIGWITWLVGSITSALLIVAALNSLMPTANPLLKIGIAIGILILLTLIALRGVEASTAILVFFAIIALLVIIGTIAGAFMQVNTQNYTPFFKQDTSPYFIFIALFFIIETFIGWESATFMGGETKNPEKTIPKGIIISSIIVAALIFIYPIVILGFMPWETLINLDTPFATITYLLFGQTGMSFVNIAVFLVLVGSAAGGIVSTPRLIQALAKDKLFIEQLSAVHPKYKTPYKAIFFQTIVSILVMITAFGDYASLLSLLIPLAIIMYISVILAVPILRVKYPDLKRYVSVPFGKIGPIILSLFYAGIIVLWLLFIPNSWHLFRKIISFILFGVPIYILLNMYYNPDLLLKTMNSFATLSRFFERFILPKRIKQEMLGIFKGINGKTVLEFGSGVGAFTLDLATAVGDKGKIYAVDLSPNNIHILNRRLAKQGHKQVKVILDEHFISRIHPDIPRVDMIFSVGNLSYIQDIEKVLKDMYVLLPENGQICLVEYVNYFWGIIPNQAWLDDKEELEKIFRKVGFSIRIKKKRGFFWQYLFIYGIKSNYDVPVI